MVDHLMIIGERRGLAWVLDHQKMAFPAGRESDAQTVAVGDSLFMYTTRGCFHNPTVDRGRIVGRAIVRTPVRRSAKALFISGKQFLYECAIEIVALAPFRTGVELQPLVPRLEAFPDPATWSARMRRALLPLSPADGRLLRAEVDAQAKGDVAEALHTYRRPVARDHVRQRSLASRVS
jgi:hypothetical protein